MNVLVNYIIVDCSGLSTKKVLPWGIREVTLVEI